MTINEFNAFSKEVQLDVLLQEGIFLCYRTHGKQYIDLYQIEAFYVEVYYNQKQNRIPKLKSFLSTDALKPYFHLIPLTGLFI